ncbi:serine/threonine-protein kinase [Streptomyces sp. ME19-01-6]|uniref:serine/threonine-protein kinase n=1 Tax=Streptomyces sp. ME19-01-6 TaxID=3028686 RepID=UPI0029A1EC4D|nr:serine/threonine-protein kinase [Streptomyces sp. ME19-01-6]MDX3228201.1 serine/threonine-protein kinase [Streptomyces sp. ME19-01-6]
MPPVRRAGTGPEAEDPEYAGQYRLEAHLGSGGMGVVHLARSASGRRLAVKVVHAEYAEDPEFRARFRQEVAAARRVSGAFTAPVVDADPDGERPWMATLYIPGPTLAEHVKRNGPLPTGDMVRLAAGLAEALRDIHRAGVVHRDLKPSNVLLAADGPKVIDFGISRPSDSELRTETGKLIGTPPFMAPEQFQRPRHVGPAADVFALGSVLVHAATGRGPFESESPYIVAYQVVHDEADLAGVPRELLPLVQRCLAKDPAERPTPDALMTVLRAISGPHPPALRGPLPRVPAQRGRGTGPLWGDDDDDDGSVTDSSVSEDGRDAAIDAGTEAATRAGAEVATGGGSPDASDAVNGDAAVNTHPAADPVGTGSPAAEGHTDDPPYGGRDADTQVRAGSLPAVTAGRRHRTARRWVTVGVLAVVMLGAGTVWALQRDHDGRRSAHRQPTGATKAAAWRPWKGTLPTDGSGAEGEGIRAAFCSYGGGALYCAGRGVAAARIDPADGKVLWWRPAAAGRPDDGTPTAPALSGGLVQVVSPDGARLRALDPKTGRPRWSRDVASYEGRVYPAGDTVLLVAADGVVTAVDGATNKRRWSHAVPGHARPAFVSYGDGRTAYALTTSADGAHTLVTAVDPARGTTRWQRSFRGNLTPAGADSEGVLYLTGTDAQTRTATVVRYDPAHRAEHRVALATPVSATSVAVRGGMVYLLCSDGGLVAVDPRRTDPAAAQRWRLETSVGNASPLVASGDRLYFSAADGRLLAVDAVGGELLGQTPPRTGKAQKSYLELVPAPVAADGKVYGSTPDGTVFGMSGRDPARW